MSPSPPGTIKLPGCDLPISRMGVGTWAWGDRAVWGMNGYDRSYGLDTIREAYARSVSAGLTLFDSAEAYGRGESERILGSLLAADEEHRDRIFVATKFIPLPWRVALRHSLVASARASLERLRLPFIHLYQIHGPISLRSHQAMADALAAARDLGLIKAVGVSNYSEAEMRSIHAALAKHGIALATNQVEYSLLRTLPETGGLMAACRELGVTMLAYSPLGQGRLTGKYGPGHPPQGRRSFSAYPMEEIASLLRELGRIGDRHGGRTHGQVALNWIMCKGAVPIPGAKNARQAEQNAGALGWQLDAEDIAALDRAARPGLRTLGSRLWQHG